MDRIESTAEFLEQTVTKAVKRPKPRKKAVMPKAVKVAALEMVEKALVTDTKEAKTYLDKFHFKTEVFTAFKYFEDVVGGRTKLIETLAYCPPSSLGYSVVEKIMADPEVMALMLSEEGGEETAKVALSQICLRNKLPFNAIVAAFRDARIAQTTIETLTAISDKTPLVAKQLAEDAQNRWEDCTICHGVGRVTKIGQTGEWEVDEYFQPITQLCFNCRGEGKVFVKHDFQNRKAFLEAVGVLKKEPLVQTTNTQTIDNRTVTVSGLPGDGSFEGVMKSLDAMIRKPVVKATELDVIDVQPENNQPTSN